MIGYQIQRCSLESMLKDLNCCQEIQDHDAIAKTVRKALQRYPNHFEINYMCALLLIQIAESQNCNSDYEAALIQLERACELIDQNTDDRISELTIRNKMAQLHFLMGHTDISLEMLKKYNSCNINDAQIGCILTDCYHNTKEASVYLKRAFSKIITDLENVVTGFMTLFLQNKEYDTLIYSIEWLCIVLQGKQSEDAVTWFHKYECVLLAIEAEVFCIMGNEQQAKEKLIEAAILAQRFDAASDCDIKMSHLFQVMGAKENHYMHYGKTAVEALKRRVFTDVEAIPQLAVLWEKVLREVLI